MALGEINKYNFLRWVQKAGTAISVDDRPLFNNGYKRYSGNAYIVLVPGERMSFYINANANFSDSNIPNLQIGGKSLGPLSIIPIEGGKHYYISFIVPALADGFYRLEIFEYIQKVLESNPVRVMNLGYEKTTAKVKFRHNTNIFNHLYESIPAFYNEFRLLINNIETQNESNIETYRSVSTGKRRNYKESSERFRKFEAYSCDDDMHEAIETMLEHDELYINSRKVTLKEVYKRSTDPTKFTTKGEFAVYEDDYPEDKFNNSIDTTQPDEDVFHSVAKSGNFQKNNCESGYIGSRVTYTVPAGTYTSLISQADADAKAQDDVDNNGQAYANANGTCSQSTMLNYNFSVFKDPKTYADYSQNIWPLPMPSHSVLALRWDNSNMVISGTGNSVCEGEYRQVPMNFKPPTDQSPMLGKKCKLSITINDDYNHYVGNGEPCVDFVKAIVAGGNGELINLTAGLNEIEFNYPATAQTYSFGIVTCQYPCLGYMCVAMISLLKLEIVP